MERYLHEMIRTGDAILADGVLIESGEYVAALYESYAADHEWNSEGWGKTIPEWTASLRSMADYALTAERLVESLWTRDVRSVRSD